MAKDKLTEYDATAANNTVVGDVNLAENSALPSDMNNAVREVMSHLKGFASGTDAIDALTVTGDLTVDTNTLHVDAANNRVGVGTTSPSQVIDAVATGSSTSVILAQNTTSNNGAAHLRAKNPQNELIIGTDNHSGGLTGTANASFLYTSSTTPIIFMPNGTEKMRLLSGGGITFNGDTAAANALSDYEEGLHVTTATPSGSGTVTLNSSYDTMAYTKIGRLVLITGEISISSVSSPTGSVLDFTVPFACSSLTELSERAGGGVFWTEAGVEFPFHVLPFLTFSGSIIRIFKDASAFSAGDSISFGASYLTDS